MNMPSQSIAAFFSQLNHDYVEVHRAKEELFWATYMGFSEDHAGFARAEQAYKAFVSSPATLDRVRDALARLEAGPDADGPDADGLRRGLKGWQAFFESQVLDSPEAQAHMEELVELESALFARRKDHVLTHLNEQGEREEASLGMLAVNMATNPQEDGRRSSHEAMRGLEHWVLANGFLDLVRKRNALARNLGYADYFEYKVRKNEHMSVAELFAILDDFEARTRAAQERSLAELARAKGPGALAPHNLRFHMAGDVTRQMDPYFSFAKGLERWALSFRRLGIAFRGATLQLDLLERKGKYQNGFCHQPVPCFFDEGRWVAARVNFTSEGKPDQVGSGARALNTLFHEGGHAAHMSNVTRNAPCFSQEYPPTSMAYAETQSMFCESLLEDADWLKRYALDAAGRPIPDALIREKILLTQPFRAFDSRMILVVPYFERALYELPEARLEPDTVLALARDCERRILRVEGSPRPLLAIPHLLNQESAASYHGYLLAEMAVHQTRAHFLKTFGHLTDNPAIGPLLSRHYWEPGNSLTHDETLRSLTGEGFSARYLSEACNATPEEAWQQAQACMAAAARRPAPAGEPAPLDATIRIVHGAELIADNRDSDRAMFDRFEAWIGENYFRVTAS